MSFAKSFMVRTQAVVVAAAVAGVLVYAGHDVYAAVDPGAACAASKQKAAAKKLSDKIKCHGVAIKKEQAVDPACLSKAETKFEGSFAKAEDKGGCATTGDVDEIELFIDDVLNQLLAALPPTPPVTEDCDNLGDDDGDGFVDCDDNDCVGDPACAPAEVFCDNDVDDDGDGFADCNDSDCAADPLCAAPESICDDTIDNDTDGFTDCDDLDCVSDPVCP
jgi:hypothetical protein